MPARLVVDFARPKLDASPMDSLEIAERYLDRLSENWVLLLGVAALGTFCVGLYSHLTRRSVAAGDSLNAASAPVVRDGAANNTTRRVWARLSPILLLTILGAVGVTLALRRAAMFDDAYISFRYARNWVAGNGLVFNVGEKVEGYTNFLWTAAIALFMKLGFGDAPEIALVASLLCFVGNLIATFLLSRELREPASEGRQPFPFAVLLLSVSGLFTDYATSGMEAGFASLLVQCGLLLLLRAERPPTLALSSLLFILATMTRPDHALFYAWGSATVAVLFLFPTGRKARPSVWDWGLSGRFAVAWAVPFLLYVGYAAVKYGYYGEWVPNTYYAKSASKSYFSQGLLYAETFYLGTHFWLVIALFVVACVLRPRSPAQARFRLFSAGSVAIFNFYVVRVGGDFMYGRFYITLMPLMLLGAEVAVHRVLDAASPSTKWTKVAGYLLGGLLLCTAGGVSLIRPRMTEWRIADESSFYPLSQLFPVEVDHGNFRTGVELQKLHSAGLSPLIATSAIGMLGYQSHLPIVDLVGLVDAEIGRSKLLARGRPGHEKKASTAYLARRNPHLVRNETYVPVPYRKLTRIQFAGVGTKRRWDIYHYDRKVMRQIAEVLPGTKFRRFEPYFDRYARRAKKRLPKAFARDRDFFQRYYFDHNDDPARERKLENLSSLYKKRSAGRLAEARKSIHKPRSPRP